jgi:DNA-binding transcriptional MerR regulator
VRVSGWRLRIGELAHLAGVTTRTLRHFERVGVLAPPDRAENGYRSYPASALVDVLEVRRLQESGLTLHEAAVVRRERAAGQDGSILDRLDEAETDLEAEIERLVARRTALRELRATLTRGDAVLATGASDSFAGVAHHLRRLGVSDRAVAEQSRAWSALRNIHLPDDWETAVAAGVAQLERSSAIDGLADALDLVASLRGADPLDPEVVAVGDRVAEFVLDIPSTQSSLALAGPTALPILAVVASCFTAAQIVALLRAIEVLRERTSAGTTT